MLATARPTTTKRTGPVKRAGYNMPTGAVLEHQLRLLKYLAQPVLQSFDADGELDRTRQVVSRQILVSDLARVLLGVVSPDELELVALVHVRATFAQYLGAPAAVIEQMRTTLLDLLDHCGIRAQPYVLARPLPVIKSVTGTEADNIAALRVMTAAERQQAGEMLNLPAGALPAKLTGLFGEPTLKSGKCQIWIRGHQQQCSITLSGIGTQPVLVWESTQRFCLGWNY
jgi:hypothetical protein